MIWVKDAKSAMWFRFLSLPVEWATNSFMFDTFQMFCRNNKNNWAKIVTFVWNSRDFPISFRRMYERVVAFFTSVQEFFVANSQLKNSNLLNSSMIPDPFVAHAKVSLAKSSNKGYGDKNGFRAKSAPTDRWKQWLYVPISKAGQPNPWIWLIKNS